MQLAVLLTPRCLSGEACPFLQGEFCDNAQCAVESDEVKLPCSVTEHEKRLKRLACCVSGRTPVSLHHCRGGSMAENLFGTPGVGQKQNDALQIPLHPEYHYGSRGVDARIQGGVLTWEWMWGRQVDYLSSTARQLRYSPWTLAWSWASPLVRARVERFLGQSRSRSFPP